MKRKELGKSASKALLLVTALILLGSVVKAQIGNVIWEDNFNSFNTAVWTPNIGDGCDEGICGWGNAELEYYSDNNISIEAIPGETGNNALVLEAKNESVGTQSFTSGKVDSDGKLSVQYGLIEIRMRTPDVETGLWPAAWLLGTANLSWPAKGEIDMMEMGHADAERERLGYAGSDINSYVGANAIFANTDGSVGSIAYDVNYNQPYIASSSLADRFVTYRLYWEPTQMRYTVVDNGIEYDLYTNPLPLDADGVTGAFTKPFYFLLNLAVGGNFTDAATANQVTAPLPAKLYIDYVRVSEWNGYGTVETDYSQLVAETGTFGIFTETTSTNNSLNFGGDAEIYVWGETMQDGTETANEGSEVLAWETTTANDWFGGGITALFGKDMSNYVDNGSLKFDIKIPADVSFRIGITDNYTNESWITFDANQTQYGLTRNGNWGTVEIPIVDFAGLIAFQNINYMFAIASLDGAFPSSTIQFGVDDIVWDDGAASISVTGVNVTPATASLIVGDTQLASATISPSNATNQYSSWSSSNTSVATVNSDGLVTAQSAGSATITATTVDGGYTGTTVITVTAISYMEDNLALNSTAIASQSSNYSNTLGLASNAIDGDQNGEWTGGSVTHTADSDTNDSWQVDLGTTESIGDIIIYNRTGCCMQRLDDITVSVESTSGTVLWSENVISNSPISITVNAAGASGRIIKISQNGTSVLSLAEVEVYEYDGVTSTFPDPNKTYYIDCPAHNLRVAATGQSEDAYTTTTTTTGDDVEWVFVDQGNGYWHIDRAAGGTKPRLRTDNSENADMQATSSSGTFTYYELTEGSTTDTYFLTLPNGPASYQRLQMNSAGEMKFVTTASALSWESFSITEAIESTSTTLMIEAESFTATNDTQNETNNGITNVGYINNGSWMDYSVTIPSDGTYTINYRVASIPGGGSVQFQAGGNTLATTTIDPTGGWYNWTTLSTTVTLAAGSQTVRLYSASGYWNIDWFEITNVTSARTTAGIDELFLEVENTVNLYPVPAQNQLNVAIQNFNEYQGLEIFNMTGKIVFTQTHLTGKTTSLNVEALPKGVYFLKVYRQNTSAEVLRFTK